MIFQVKSKMNIIKVVAMLKTCLKPKEEKYIEPEVKFKLNVCI